jgi:hypothetical protein
MELAYYETKAYTFTVVPDDNKTLTSDQPLFVQLLGKNGKTALQVTLIILSNRRFSLKMALSRL